MWRGVVGCVVVGVRGGVGVGGWGCGVLWWPEGWGWVWCPGVRGLVGVGGVCRGGCVGGGCGRGCACRGGCGRGVCLVLWPVWVWVGRGSGAGVLGWGRVSRGWSWGMFVLVAWWPGGLVAWCRCRCRCVGWAGPGWVWGGRCRGRELEQVLGWVVGSVSE